MGVRGRHLQHCETISCVIRWPSYAENTPGLERAGAGQGEGVVVRGRSAGESAGSGGAGGVSLPPVSQPTRTAQRNARAFLMVERDYFQIGRPQQEQKRQAGRAAAASPAARRPAAVVESV